MEDRRRYTRVPQKAKIFYELIPSGKEGLKVTEDISRGGMKFMVKEPIPEGSLLKSRVTFHESSLSFEAWAKVARIRELCQEGKYEVGAQFVEIRPDAAEYLALCIDDFRRYG